MRTMRLGTTVSHLGAGRIDGDLCAIARTQPAAREGHSARNVFCPLVAEAAEGALGEGNGAM
eukprot:7947770-Alexandrium_andersonii.AAC.1